MLIRRIVDGVGFVGGRGRGNDGWGEGVDVLMLVLAV